MNRYQEALFGLITATIGCYDPEKEKDLGIVTYAQQHKVLKLKGPRGQGHTDLARKLGLLLEQDVLVLTAKHVTLSETEHLIHRSYEAFDAPDSVMRMCPKIVWLDSCRRDSPDQARKDSIMDRWGRGGFQGDLLVVIE